MVVSEFIKHGYANAVKAFLNAIGQPVNFVFKTHQSKNDTSNVYSIKVDLSAPLATPTDLYIVGLYDTYLTLEYDDMSRLKSMLPSPAMPLME